MDQIKIGRFIAAERKQKGLTQRALAEKLCISDKTISKWERGNGFPEISLVQPLCEALTINVNELLSGERLEENDYKRKAEENIVNLVKEKQESKKKILLTVGIIVLTLVGAITLIMLAGYLEMAAWLRGLLIGIALFEIALGITMGCVLDREAGAYECPKCKHRFVPGMRGYVKGVHSLTRRWLICPHCGEKHFCRRVLTK